MFWKTITQVPFRW